MTTIIYQYNRIYRRLVALLMEARLLELYRSEALEMTLTVAYLETLLCDEKWGRE